MPQIVPIRKPKTLTAHAQKPLCLALCLCLFVGGLAGCGKKEAPSTSPPPSLPALNIPPPTTSSQVSSVVSSAPVESMGPSSISTTPSSISTAPVVQPPPVFTDGTPSPVAQGRMVTVTYKTDVPSTVNTILSTEPAAVSVAKFYDYFNRGQALPGALEKQKLHGVGSAGKFVYYEIKDPTKPHYVLCNAAEDATGTWQNSVTITKVYEPGTQAPSFVSVDRTTDVNGNICIAANMDLPCTVYAMIYAEDTMPTAQQVRDGGAGFNGTFFTANSGNTNTDKAPYIAMVQLARTNMQVGQAYYVFVVGQVGQGPLGQVGKVRIVL